VFVFVVLFTIHGARGLIIENPCILTDIYVIMLFFVVCCIVCLVCFVLLLFCFV